MSSEVTSTHPDDQDMKRVVSWSQLAESPDDAVFILDTIRGLSPEFGDDPHTKIRRQRMLDKLSSKTPEELAEVEVFVQSFLDRPQPSVIQDETYSHTDIPPGESPV